MQVNVTELHGPSGETADERAVVVIESAHGEKVRVEVWLDRYSSADVSVFHADRDGKERDVLDSARKSGALLGAQVLREGR